MAKLLIGVVRVLLLGAVVLAFPAVAGSQSTQPSPGWYKNSGPSNISQVSPWRVVWQNSYIYQHPGTDNLYWYAQVEFHNVSSQTQNFVCNGVGCPSCIKEHIERGGTYLGFVTAEDTFCMRNPNFTAPVKPGEAFDDWVIFHNVPWKGDAVSLEWGSSGATAYVNPWSSTLSAPPPVECPPELVTLGTCMPVSRTPEGKHPNLIVLVHGCCTDKNSVKEWDGLGAEIGKKILESKTSDKWEIVVWDWSQDTPPLPGMDYVAFKAYADIAYKAAENRDGLFLANAIANYSYEYIHLIGHSAGAKLIHVAATDLIGNNKIKQEQPFIHLSFLDAYTQNDKDSGKEAENGIHKGYGYLEGYSDHYAEHYVDRHLPSTDACLASAFNFDISNWKHSPDLTGDPVGHQWPRHWYEKSVQSTQTITYSGTFTNTTFNSHGNVVIDFDMESNNAVSGSINFTGDLGQTLCGAGNFTGSIQGNSIQFSFISRDPDPGCGFDWGWHFTVSGTLSDSGRVFAGSYSIDNGQQGVFQATVLPEFKYGFPLSLEGGNNLNNLINRRDTEFRPGKQCDLGTGLFNENPNPDCHPADCW